MFKSKCFPEMDPFLQKLEEVLVKLPNNPKPSCKGFYLSDYDQTTNIMIVEEIGVVLREKKHKYLDYVSKKVTQTLLFKVNSSRELFRRNLGDAPIGSVFSSGYCVAVSGHVSEIDEAIAFLWLIARHFVISRKGIVMLPNFPLFFEEFIDICKELEKKWVLKNPWIKAILAIF
ncbi:MAG: hypothetical protein ABH951_00735 [Patescibacteria group bacterium]